MIFLVRRPGFVIWGLKSNAATSTTAAAEARGADNKQHTTMSTEQCIKNAQKKLAGLGKALLSSL